MAAKRRRRSFARRGAPGKTFWLRPTVFDVTVRDTTDGVFSDIILAESDFQSPSAALNDTMKGAPVLERLIVDCEYNQTVDNTYFDPAGNGQVTMLVEAMVFTQEDQFVSTVTDTTTFDTVLENNRILGYQVMEFSLYTGVYYGSTAINTVRTQCHCHAHFEPKSRVKLRERSVAVAYRTNMDIAHGSIEATFPWVQPTMLVRVP